VLSAGGDFVMRSIICTDRQLIERTIGSLDVGRWKRRTDEKEGLTDMVADIVTIKKKSRDW
jgi:hypothetical protein